MEKLLEIVKGIKPGQYLLLTGTALLALGAVGSIAGYSVVPGQEVLVFFTGVFIMMVGTYLSYVRAKMENEAKRELENDK